MSSQAISESYLLQSHKRYCTPTVETNNELWAEMIVSTGRWIARHMGCDRYKGSRAIHSTVTANSLRPRDERGDWRHSLSLNLSMDIFSWVNVKWSKNWYNLVEFTHPLAYFQFGKWFKMQPAFSNLWLVTPSKKITVYLGRHVTFQRSDVCGSTKERFPF